MDSTDVARSLAQQEEYRVRDTERVPAEVVVSIDSVVPAWGEGSTREEAIADLVTWVVGTRRELARERDNLAPGLTEQLRFLEAVMEPFEAEAALLAQSAPGDRDDDAERAETGLREAAEAVVEYAALYDYDPWPIVALRRALAADSRPEQPAPRTWPSRDEFSRMTPSEVNDYFASVGLPARVAVRPEEPPA